MTPNKNGKVLQKSLEFVMLQINFKIKNKLLHPNFELFTLFSSIGVLVSFRGPPDILAVRRCRRRPSYVLIFNLLISSCK